MASYNYFTDSFEPAVKRYAGAVALLSVPHERGIGVVLKVTYGELHRHALAHARTFVKMGMRKGDTLLVMLPRCLEWYGVVLACIRLGVVPVPTSVQCPSSDVTARVERAGARVVVVSVDLVERCRDLPCPVYCCTHTGSRSTVESAQQRNEKCLPLQLSVQCDLPPVGTLVDDPMILYFTSGTTSRPKMVRHAQGYALAHMRTAKLLYEHAAGDVHWTISDTGWAKTAFGKLFAQFAFGVTVLQFRMDGRFSAARMCEILRDHRVTSFCAPPTAYRMALQERDLLQQTAREVRAVLLRCQSAGEPLNPEVFQQWLEIFKIPIREFYGQTETITVLGTTRNEAPRPGSMGKAVMGYDVVVVDEDGNELERGKEGHVVIRWKERKPLGVMIDYWNDEQGQASAFAFPNSYCTHDVAVRDDDGYFWFVGRDDDVFKASGYRISPFEIESALLEHSAVVESAVVGSPDANRGMVIKAFIVLSRDAQTRVEESITSIKDYARAHMAPYKVPKRWEVVDELPKTVSGKTRRSLLRQREREAHARL